MTLKSAKRQYFLAFFLISLGCLFIGASLVLLPVGNALETCSRTAYNFERTMRIPISGTVSLQQPFYSSEINWFWNEEIEIHDFLTNGSEVILRFYDSNLDYSNETVYYNVTGTPLPLSFSIQVTGHIIFEVWMNSSPAYFTTWITYTLPPPPPPPCTTIPLFLFGSGILCLVGLIILISGVNQARKGEQAIKFYSSRDMASPTKSQDTPGYRSYNYASACFALGFIFLGVSGLLLI